MPIFLLALFLLQDKASQLSYKRIAPEISYFGKVQFQSYRGFAWISTPILYIITIISEIQIRPDLTSLIILLYPIILIGAYMPLIVLYEKRLNKIGAKIIKKFDLKLLHLDGIN